MATNQTNEDDVVAGDLDSSTDEDNPRAHKM